MRLSNKYWILFLIFINYNAIACTCMYFSDTTNLAQRIKVHDVIFEGRVTKIEVVNSLNSNEKLIKFVFKITKFYKNNSENNNDEFIVYQRLSNCKFDFDILKRYMVYLYKDNNIYFTDQCTPTVLASKSKYHKKYWEN